MTVTGWLETKSKLGMFSVTCILANQYNSAIPVLKPILLVQNCDLVCVYFLIFIIFLSLFFGNYSFYF